MKYLAHASEFLPFVQVQGILIGVVAAFVIIVTIIGPEYDYFFFAFLHEYTLFCISSA